MQNGNYLKCIACACVCMFVCDGVCTLLFGLPFQRRSAQSCLRGVSVCLLRFMHFCLVRLLSTAVHSLTWRMRVWVRVFLACADAEQEDPDDAMSSKENRPARGNTCTASTQPRSSVESSKATGRTNSAASTKTRRSARLSGSSSNSATQHSPGPRAPQEPATQDSAAPDSLAQAPARQSSVSEQEAAVTPVKAQQAKPADDLDKLLGSRLKSVRPQVELRPSEEAAASPVAALRGQLRRVKLEPDEPGLSSARQGQGQGTGGTADGPVQVRTAHFCKLGSTTKLLDQEMIHNVCGILCIASVHPLCTAEVAPGGMLCLHDLCLNMQSICSVTYYVLVQVRKTSQGRRVWSQTVWQDQPDSIIP